MLHRSLAPSLPRFLVVVVAGSLLTLALPRSAHAACGWDAELTAVTHDPRSSAAFTVSWAAAASSCGSFSLLKYRIVLNDAGTPTSPTDGIQFDAPAVNTSRNTFQHGANESRPTLGLLARLLNGNALKLKLTCHFIERRAQRRDFIATAHRQHPDAQVSGPHTLRRLGQKTNRPTNPPG